MATKFIEDAYRFLNLVLPEAPIYGAGEIEKSTGKFKQYICNNKGTIIEHNRDGAIAKLNTYFALASYKQGWYKNANNKFKFRTQENVAKLRCLWLDIDAGKPQSVYHNAEEALRATAKFIKDTKLPLPTTVLSGTGLHLYWPFEASIEPNNWTAMAGMLKNLCVAQGYDADHSRTTDPASVLRLPGTINYGKDGVARVVRVLAWSETYKVLDIAKTLLDATKRLGADVATPMRTRPVGSGLATPPPPDASFHFYFDNFEAPLRDARNIFKECLQFREAGKGDYSRWFNMMTVAKHCQKGREVAHFVSKMDPTRYDAATVDDKYDKALESDGGPALCSTFNKTSPGICQRCRHWGKINSPISLGDEHMKEVVVELKAAPPPNVRPMKAVMEPTKQVTAFKSTEFEVRPNDGVYWVKREKVATTGGEHEWVTRDYKILDSWIYIHGITDDSTLGATERSYIIRKETHNRAPEDLLFPISEAFGAQKITTWLAHHGLLPVHPKFNKQVQDFMSTYLASVQNTIDASQVQSHFGWVDASDPVTGNLYSGFIIGDSMYSEQGVTPVKLNDRAKRLADTLETSGSLEDWMLIPHMYQKLKQPFGALMILASFAAPFMRYGNGTATNVAYNFWDLRGGKGKTTALRAAAGVWGNPLYMLQGKSDTHSSRFQKFAVYKNLPCFIDELTTMDTDDVAALVYDLVNGREKSRATKAGTDLAVSGTWDTITMITSNRSLYESLRNYRVQSDATCMRVVEMGCDFDDYTGTPMQQYIAEIADSIDVNYGLAGRAFMRWCFKHPDVFSTVSNYARAFALKHMKQSDERFWLYGLAMPLAVGYLTNTAGLTSYDMKWLTDYVVNTVLPTIRGAVHTDVPTGETLLSEFLNAHIDETLVVTSRRRPTDVKDSGELGMDAYVKMYPRNKLSIRVEQDKGMYYVSSKALSHWCLTHRVSLNMLLSDLKARGIWTNKNTIQVSLGKHVKIMDRSRTMVYVFQLDTEVYDDDTF